MNKKPIIYRYVQTGLRAFVSLFRTKAKAVGKDGKNGIKIASGGSEIVLNNFSNNHEDKKSCTSPKQQEQLHLPQFPKSHELNDVHSSMLPWRLFRDLP
jgi:hypothetical protein